MIKLNITALVILQSSIALMAAASVVLTGYQLRVGGRALILGGWLAGGRLESFSPTALALMTYMVPLSSVAFAL